jgi:SecD/SecF fusion protein
LAAARGPSWRFPISHHLGRRAVAVILLIGAAAAVVLSRPVHLGLDLRGGTQVALEAQDTPTRKANADATDRALEVIRRRVDQLGLSEPTIQRSGERRIMVELPGVADPEEALRVIGRTAQLTFHPVLGIAGGEQQPEASPSSSPGPTPTGASDQDTLILPDESGARLRLGPPRLTGEAVRDAQAVFDSQQLTSQWMVNVTFAGNGDQEWESSPERPPVSRLPTP